MTGKEALEKIGTTTHYEWSNKPLSEYFKKEFDIIEKSLTELEELKNDVKRFMELYNPPQPDDEYDILRVKLSKVGKNDDK